MWAVFCVVLTLATGTRRQCPLLPLCQSLPKMCASVSSQSDSHAMSAGKTEMQVRECIARWREHPRLKDKDFRPMSDGCCFSFRVWISLCGIGRCIALRCVVLCPCEHFWACLRT